MNQEDYYRNNLIYYFVVMGIGGLFIYIGRNFPTYNEQTGEILKPYSVPLVVFGVILIVVSFIGMIVLNINIDKENKE